MEDGRGEEGGVRWWGSYINEWSETRRGQREREDRMTNQSFSNELHVFMHSAITLTLHVF